MKKVLALLVVLLLLCGCDDGIWMNYVQTSYGLSTPVDTIPEDVEAPDEVRRLLDGFVARYEQMGNRVSEFRHPAKISVEQLIMTAMFLRQDAFADRLSGGKYYVSTKDLYAVLTEIYAEDTFADIYLSEYYDQEYDRFVIPEEDLPDPVSVIGVLVDYNIASNGDIYMKLNVYSQILTDPAQTRCQYVLNHTVGYRFKNTEDGYRLYASMAYFKSTGVEL